MKFIALSHDGPTTLWDQVDPGLPKAGAHRVHEPYLSGCLREIHFTDAGDAVPMPECPDKDEAEQTLRSLPYTGLERIIAEPLLTEG